MTGAEEARRLMRAIAEIQPIRLGEKAEETLKRARLYAEAAIIAIEIDRSAK